MLGSLLTLACDQGWCCGQGEDFPLLEEHFCGVDQAHLETLSFEQPCLCVQRLEYEFDAHFTKLFFSKNFLISATTIKLAYQSEEGLERAPFLTQLFSLELSPEVPPPKS